MTLHWVQVLHYGIAVSGNVLDQLVKEFVRSITRRSRIVEQQRMGKFSNAESVSVVQHCGHCIAASAQERR